MMERYRVMNLPAGQVMPPRPTLGQVPAPAPSQEVIDASKALASARKAEANVRSSYARLVTLLGEERAGIALAEAQESLAAAEAEYNAAVGGA